MLKHIDDECYEEEVLNTKGICVVDFYATWCGPCMRLAPILEEVANSRKGYNIKKVDVDKNPGIASRLSIDTVPTFCIYKDGVLVDRRVGYMPKEEIMQLIEKYDAE